MNDHTLRVTGCTGATGATGSTGSTGATGACGPIVDYCNTICDLEELEKKANKTILVPRLATITGNAISLFTMLVLQEIIEQQALSPIANLSSILQISNSIALLNASIKDIQ